MRALRDVVVCAAHTRTARKEATDGGLHLRRLLQVMPMLLAVTFVVFLLIQLAPYDVVDAVTTPQMSDETVAVIRERYGLDQPVIVQYGFWLGNVLQGDLGYSLTSRHSIAEDLAVRIPNTILLVAPAYLTALVLALVLGLVADRARAPGSTRPSTAWPASASRRRRSGSPCW